MRRHRFLGVLLAGCAIAGPLLAHGAVNPVPQYRRTPWVQDMTLPWKAAFLPPQKQPGYDAVKVSIASALTQHPDVGGWQREPRPSLVLLWNPANPDHQKAAEALRTDARFRNAAHLFNCYRMDIRGLKDDDSGRLYLSVFLRNGNHFGSVEGTDRLKRAFHLLDAAYAKDRSAQIGKRLPRLDAALKDIAEAKYYLERLDRLVICPHCGRERDDIQAQIKRYKTQETDALSIVAAAR